MSVIARRRLRHLAPLAVAAGLAACGGGGTGQPADARATLDGEPGADGPPGVDAPPGTDGPSTAGDPAGDGPAAVTEHTASIPGATPGRTLTATVYTPSTGATPRPVVLISPGFQMARTQYASYAHHLATWGFGVVLTDYADTSFFPDHQALADDVRAAITWALADPGLAADPDAIGLAGHSLGGKISMLAAADDNRVGAVVGWDPVDANSPSVAPQRMADITGAVAVIGETTNGSGGAMPCAPAADNFQQFYAAAHAPALRMTVMGADHMDWVDDPSCGFCGFCTPGSAPEELARAASRRLDVAWFRRQLLGDTAMDPWLSSPPEVAAGTATVAQK